MGQITLGRTGIVTNKNGFGALPIQRISESEAVHLLQRAYENGITFFDTARAYSDSEEKLGKAFKGLRSNIFISTKTTSKTADGFWTDLETSLKNLQTDYVDILQFHTPPFCPKAGGEDGLYDAALKAKEQGKIRFIGLTNHNYQVAEEAIASDLYDTIQFPFNYLSTEIETNMVKHCEEKNLGFIAMKALSGGLLNHADACYAYLNQFPNVLPIWGMQKESELDEFISFMKQEPVLDDKITSVIEKDREQLIGEFCRSCGYCMPCPMGIKINNCARISLLLRRARPKDWLTEEWQAEMKKIETCIHCNQCMGKCPYHLNTPELLQKNLEDYKKVLSGEITL